MILSHLSNVLSVQFLFFSDIWKWSFGQTIPKCCQLKMQAYLLLVSERGHFKAAIFDDTVISVSTGMFGKMEREVEEKGKGEGEGKVRLIFL